MWKLTVCDRLHTMVVAAIQTVLLTSILLLLVATGHCDGIASYPAYWQGAQVDEFLASSAYLTCREVALPPDLTTVGQIKVDPESNLWISGMSSPGVGAGLVEALASRDYKQFRRLMPGERPGAFAFDYEGNLFALTGALSAPWATKQVRELLKTTSYEKEIDFTVPSGGVPLDLTLDSSGNVWIPSLSNMTNALERDVIELSKRDNYSQPETLSVACAVRHLVLGRTGAIMASTDEPNSLVELKKADRSLLCPRVLAEQPDIAKIALDFDDNLWVLTQAVPGLWFTSNRVLELTKDSQFSQQKTFAIPRRVFGITVDQHDNVWTTSPFKNVPYSMGGFGNHAGPQPDDITKLVASSGYSQPQALVVPGWPFGIVADHSGNLWIANGKPDSGNVVEILPSGANRTFSVPGKPYGVAIDFHSNPWLTGSFPGYEVAQLARDKGYSVAHKLRTSGRALGIAFDPSNNLWVAELDHPESNLIEFTVRSNYGESRPYTIKGSPFALVFDSSANLWAAAAGCPRDRIVELLKSDGYTKEISYPVDGRPYGVAVDSKGDVWAAVASEPKAEVIEFARKAGYRKSRSLKLPAYGTVAVDRSGNVWVHSFDYVETRSLSSASLPHGWYR
jgi:streptogramin lyase